VYLYENHGAEPGARDNAYGCHAGCFAPIAPATGASHLRRSAKNMKYKTPYLALVAILALSGCAKPSERIDPSGSITTFDLNQADFIRKVFDQEPAIRGKFEVTPDAKDIFIRFKEDLPEGRESVFMERMTHMKSVMEKEFARPINVLVFQFPSKEIKI
jgi:hypothetical protein